MENLHVKLISDITSLMTILKLSQITEDVLKYNRIDKMQTIAEKSFEPLVRIVFKDGSEKNIKGHANIITGIDILVENALKEKTLDDFICYLDDRGHIDAEEFREFVTDFFVYEDIGEK